MPTAEAITRVLATMTNDLSWLAIAWHGVALAAIIAVIRGWQPSRRTACILSATPILSVAVTSAAYGNVFNALSFALLGSLLVAFGAQLESQRIEPGPAWPLIAGCATIAFGLLYPHFVEGSFLRIAVAAPVGVVPCPTLAVVAGVVIVAGGVGSRVIPVLLALWVAFYAWFGVARLGVVLDLGLGVAVVGLVGCRLDPRLTGKSLLAN